MTFILPSIGGGIVASPTAPAGLPSITNTYSVELDGTDDYIDCPTVTALNSGSAYSASLWLNYNSTNAIPISAGTGGSSRWYLHLVNSTTITYHMGPSTGTPYPGPGYPTWTVSTLSASTWYHIAFVHDGTDVTLYLNGSSQGTKTGANTANNNFKGNFIGIGRYYAIPGTYNWDGLIDEVSLFDSALSASDISAMYNSGTPNDISSLNPVGWWRMGDNNSGSGTTITDQGSGGNDGTLTNGPTFSTNAPPPLVLPSITNTYSVDFDGTNDYMDFGTNTTINSSSAFSVSAWFDVDNISSFPAICLLKTNQSNGFIIALSNTTGANQIYNGVWFGSAPTGDTNQIKGFATGNTTLATALSSGWHHLVFTYDGLDTQSASSSTVYIDGVEYTSSQAVGLPSYSNVNYVAKGGANFNGLIDEFAIFNTELTQREVTGIYNSGTPNDISSLNPVGWWRMGDNNSGSGTTITDQGSGGNDGTLTNGPTFSTTVP